MDDPLGFLAYSGLLLCIGALMGMFLCKLTQPKTIKYRWVGRLPAMPYYDDYVDLADGRCSEDFEP